MDRDGRSPAADRCRSPAHRRGRSRDGLFAGVAVVGAAISDDDGTTWLASGAGLAGVAVNAIDAGGPAGGPVYLASEGAGVYRTTDRGRTWAWLGDGPGSLLTTALAVDPTNGDRVFAGNRLDGVWRTVNGGASWQQASAGLTNQRVQALAIDPNNPSEALRRHPRRCLRNQQRR